MKVLTKRLSANDTGETGSHQVGILVPKYGGFLQFFPRLDASIKNPSKVIRFVETDGEAWSFRFIYYNGRRFGGTRNEYRLTRMTEFLRRHHAKTGDGVALSRTAEGEYSIHFVDVASLADQARLRHALSLEDVPSVEIRFDDDWSVINF